MHNILTYRIHMAALHRNLTSEWTQHGNGLRKSKGNVGRRHVTGQTVARPWSGVKSENSRGMKRLARW